MFNAGFADIYSFFYLTPWILMFLIPAITMKSLVEEYEQGTIEILKTKSLTSKDIILGKYLACSLISIIAILPTFIYVICIYFLANPIGNIDLGNIIGSYFGLFFLAFTFTSLGIFASTISKSQITAFLIAVCIGFFFYYGLEITLETLDLDNDFFNFLSIQNHFKNIAKGVLDSRDFIYFISISFAFLFTSKLILDAK
ncbi:MAG: ABC transporter permease subunit [Polaribacter sp.]|nr:ABC transporter permease subunit [Polaribacter sp.]